MKYLRISNEGVIAPQALSLLGASTKRGDSSKIGMFGSGNKYALAYFLRTGNIHIYSGKKKVPIEVKKETFRDKEFSIIYINNEKTSITTEFGLDWEFWQAVREVYTNALDEGSANIALTDTIEPKNDQTHFYIEGSDSEMRKFVDNFDSYFSEKKKVLFELDGVGQILQKTGSEHNLYRKGIRCIGKAGKQSIYDYNLLNIDIGENRLVNYWWTASEKIWSLLLGCTNETIIEHLLRNCFDNNLYEGQIDQMVGLYTVPSSEFIGVIKKLNIAPRSFHQLTPADEQGQYVWLPDRLYDHISVHINEESKPSGLRTSKSGHMYKEFTPNRLQQLTIDKALDFFKESDLSIPFEIKTAVFAKKNILGIADGDTMSIVLSDIALDKGVNDVANTIIEEYIHLKHDVKDETRAFQTAAIGEFITYMKRRNAYVL